VVLQVIKEEEQDLRDQPDSIEEAFQGEWELRINRLKAACDLIEKVTDE
jgi:hypothetical protein